MGEYINYSTVRQYNRRDNEMGWYIPYVDALSRFSLR